MCVCVCVCACVRVCAYVRACVVCVIYGLLIPVCCMRCLDELCGVVVWCVNSPKALRYFTHSNVLLYAVSWNTVCAVSCNTICAVCSTVYLVCLILSLYCFCSTMSAMACMSTCIYSHKPYMLTRSCTSRWLM